MEVYCCGACCACPAADCGLFCCLAIGLLLRSLLCLLPMPLVRAPAATCYSLSPVYGIDSFSRFFLSVTCDLFQGKGEGVGIGCESLS